MASLRFWQTNDPCPRHLAGGSGLACWQEAMAAAAADRILDRPGPAGVSPGPEHLCSGVLQPDAYFKK